jgi:hypothetical protein
LNVFDRTTDGPPEILFDLQQAEDAIPLKAFSRSALQQELKADWLKG